MKATVLVLDGVGVGELPDAPKYHDEGSNTLVHTAQAAGGLKLPNFEKLGLGNVVSIEGVRQEKEPVASFGKMAEKSPGKDTTTGHWELMGVWLNHPFPTYPQGFPSEVINKLKSAVLGSPSHITLSNPKRDIKGAFLNNRLSKPTPGL